MAAWRTGAVLHVDIDQLRFANAVLGHVEADALLKAMARLVELVCDGELVARITGARFAVFVRDAGHARTLATAVCAVFAQSFEVERAQIRAGAAAAGVIDPVGPVLTVSIGLARVADHAGPEEALEAAKGLAGDAVTAGRNRVAG